MKRRIYVETSVISYLTARPSNDAIKSACQQITRLWWDAGRASVLACISPYVVEEASAGDPAAALERIEALRPLPVLPIARDILDLAEFLLLGGGSRPRPGWMPCTSLVRLIMAWMCYSPGTALTSPTRQSMPVMRGLCAARGYKLPEPVTPFELMEEPQ